MLCLTHHLTGAVSAGIHGHVDFGHVLCPMSCTQPAHQMPSGFYTGLSFALGHSSKNKEGRVGDRSDSAATRKVGPPISNALASELGRSPGPPEARRPRRPLALTPSPPALLLRDSRCRDNCPRRAHRCQGSGPSSKPRAASRGRALPRHLGPTHSLVAFPQTLGGLMTTMRPGTGGMSAATQEGHQCHGESVLLELPWEVRRFGGAGGRASSLPSRSRQTPRLPVCPEESIPVVFVGAARAVCATLGVITL